MDNLTPLAKPSKLDLLHKGIYPAIAILIAICGVAAVVHFNLSNLDKQRQLDSLQSEMKTLKEQQMASDRHLQAQSKQAEEAAHQLRVAICKQYVSQSREMEDMTTLRNKASYALLAAAHEQRDIRRFGEENSKLMWNKAKKQAEKELNTKVINWGDI